MKVIHVVALVSPGGEYGGPTRVCFDQSRELVRRGHNVTVFAGSWGRDVDPDSLVEGVSTHLRPASLLVPRLGFATLVSRGLADEVVRAGDQADVVHIHLGRDLLTLGVARAVRRAGIPYILQTHGMIDSSPKLSAAIVDRLLTAPAVKAASDVFTLTDAEDDEMIRLGRPAGTSNYLRNGVFVDGAPRSFSGTRYDALFLARLHPRKGLIDYIRACVELARDDRESVFAYAGPDEGSLAEAQSIIVAESLEQRIRYLGPIEPSRVRDVMSLAKVYCLPAQQEPFGMTLLEAMSVGTPVVLHDTSRLANEITANGAGLSFGGPTTLSDAINSLREQKRNDSARAMALVLVQGQFGMAGVADELERSYSRASSARRVS